MRRLVLVALSLALAAGACGKSADRALKSDDLAPGTGGDTATAGGDKAGDNGGDMTTITGAGSGAPTGMPQVQVLLDGDLEIQAGAIGKDLVRKVVKDHVTKLQYCYEKTLLVDPGIAGTVTATFTIGRDGSVGKVTAKGVHPDVETCVIEAVKLFQFPPSDSEVQVAYPFTFRPA